MSDTSTSHPAPGLRNTTERFGSVAKVFHWLTALLILTLIPLGMVAYQWPYDTSEALAFKATLFSLHKTLGLLTFAVALARILWALSQPRPAHLPIESRVQAFAAQAVHWSLYGALVLVPLTGWIHHAATSGFAPIWWPFGQTLFFVPQSEPLAATFGQLHFVFNIVLVLSILLHIAGALKHHVIDRDATLKRMLPGTCDLPDDLHVEPTNLRPALAAGGIWIAAAGMAVALSLSAPEGAERPTLALAEPPSEWAVTEGTLSITVSQLGEAVTGEFAEWTAAIAFSETATDGQYGDVTVTIAIPSLTLGGVTAQALSDDFLQANAFATATYTGPIVAHEDGYIVNGTLSIVGQTVELPLPFSLELDGDTATATGGAPLDRLAVGIGTNYPDETSVGFTVDIAFSLTATRGE